jgi:hypothetical protein
MADFKTIIRPAADAAERRRHARVNIPLKARVLAADGSERPCVVVNISAGGALLKARTPPAEHEDVVLYIDEVGRFEGTVVRVGRHSFAVDYRGRRAKSARAADALTVAVHTEGPRVDRRMSPRIKHDSKAAVRLENGQTITCSILDISLTGAAIEIDPRPPLGATLTLGRMAAKVVRRHEKGVGVVFSGPAQRMEDAIRDLSDAPDGGEDGAALAPVFGKRGVTA